MFAVEVDLGRQLSGLGRVLFKALPRPYSGLPILYSCTGRPSRCDSDTIAVWK